MFCAQGMVDAKQYLDWLSRQRDQKIARRARARNAKEEIIKNNKRERRPDITVLPLCEGDVTAVSKWSEARAWRTRLLYKLAEAAAPGDGEHNEDTVKMYADLHALAVKRVTVDLWERALGQVKPWYQNTTMLRQLGKDILFKHFKVIPSDAHLFIAEERILKASTDDI